MVIEKNWTEIFLHNNSALFDPFYNSKEKAKEKMSTHVPRAELNTIQKSDLQTNDYWNVASTFFIRADVIAKYVIHNRGRYDDVTIWIIEKKKKSDDWKCCVGWWKVETPFSETEKKKPQSNLNKWDTELNNSEKKVFEETNGILEGKDGKDKY